MNPFPFIRRKNGTGIPHHKICLTASLCYLLFLTPWIPSGAYAVMPPEWYENEADHSAIKAVAEVKDVIVLSTTKQYTRKKIVFSLEKPFEEHIPGTFTGICYSVDHAWQRPGAGGTIYYYPAKGARVLVTVIHDEGAISSYTPLSPELEREIDVNGLANISFGMGHARIDAVRKQDDTQEKWFTVHMDNRSTGYLYISRSRDPNGNGIVRFLHEFIVGVPDGDRRQYRISTRSRDDDTLTPQWMVIEIRNISPKGSRKVGSREVGFRTGETQTDPEGFLPAGRQKAVDIPIPSRTTTDLLLFDLVEQLPFHAAPVSVNVIETLGLQIKKGISLHYRGLDPGTNLHRFEEEGPRRAEYWVNERHELMGVRWDEDKVFHRSTEAEAMTILQ